MSIAASRHEDRILNGVRHAGSVAYGVLEAIVGFSLMGAGIGFGGLAIFDGGRRVYREVPQDLRRSFYRAVTGRVPPAPKATTGFIHDALSLADIGLGFSVGLAGALVLLSSALMSVFTAIVFGTTLMVPMLAGAALMAGGVVSTTRRSLKWLGEYCPEDLSCPERPSATMAFVDKQAAPDFNGNAKQPAGPAIPPIFAPPVP